MKKINFAKISWVSSIFIILIIILIAVMHYKIYYQYKIKNIIYFYDCDGTLCATEVKNDNTTEIALLTGSCVFLLAGLVFAFRFRR